MSQLPIVAAFDFDGTLTYHDTLLPFLQFTNGTVVTYCKLATVLPKLLAFTAGLSSRQSAKEAILKRFLKNTSYKATQELGQKFAFQKMHDLLKPEGVKRLKWHLDQGHRCILISANMDFYLEPWAKQSGFHDVICSQSEVTQQGMITGKLKGLNCWGPEKSRRLKELLGPKENYLLYAYGDSPGDRELLAMADYAFFRTMGKTTDLSSRECGDSV